MFKNKSKKNYISINYLVTKAMLKRRRLSSFAISRITDSKNSVRLLK